MFKSRSYSGLERTSASLNDGNPIELPGNFSISFDISFWHLDFWGQILSMHAGEDQFLRVKYNDFSSTESYLIQFFVKGGPIPVEIVIPKAEYYPYKWGSVEIRIDESHTKFDIFHNEAFVGSLYSPLRIPDTLNFTFGVTHTGPFQFFEVPAMVLRDIVISHDDEVIHEWILNPQKSDVTIDSENGMPILIKNPVWLIDAHYRWVFVEQYDTPIVPSFAHDSESGRVFINDRKSLRIYNLRTGVDSSITYENPRPAGEVYSVYDRNKNLLYSTHIGRSFVSSFDFRTLRWAEYDTTKDVDLHYFGHTFWYDELTKSIYSIGGYGWYTVKDSLYRYNTSRNKWEHVPYRNGGFLPQHNITFGKGFKENEYLFFLGNGNESGKQEEDFRQLPDLFSFSLQDSVMRKIASFDITGVPNYSSRNLCLFPEDSTFFSIFENWQGDSTAFSLFLYKWNISNRTHSIVSQGLMFDKKKDKYSNLYYSDLSKSFYLFIWSAKEKKTRLYTLRFPPLEADPLIRKTESTVPTLVFVFVFVGIVVLTFILVRKIRSKSIHTNNSSEMNIDDSIPMKVIDMEPSVEIIEDSYKNPSDPIVFSDPLESDILPVAAEKAGLIPQNGHLIETLQEPIRDVENNYVSSSLKNCLLLFGGFSLFDQAGENIALQFSARIKEIFLLIAIRSFDSPESAGITSEEFSAAIWPDYSYDSAKANRNVSIGKIRKLIEKVNGLKLEFSAKIWKLIVKKGFYCDFADYQSIMNGNGFETQQKTEKLETLLQIAEKGELLSGISYDWLDSYKATINSELITMLKKQCAVFTEKADSENIIRYCNAILKIDSVDEFAFLKKMEILILEGKSGTAKACYDLFASEYKRLYDEDYPHSFPEIAERYKKS